MTELDTSDLLLADKINGGEFELSHKLSDIEILFLLASRPHSLSNLADQLKSTFGSDLAPDMVFGIVDELITQGLVRRYSNIYEETSSSYSITPLGLSKLAERLESLSEIVLKMQLGLNQQVLVTLA